MLLNLETLTGFAVIALDGKIGSVRDVLFDDESWTIRYLVVDVGNWLTRRDVVLPIASADPPDWAKKIFNVRMKKDELRNSPHVDTQKPVSRQQEIAMVEYFGLSAHWVDQEIGGSSIPAFREYPVHTSEDSHLRSVWHLAGYAVCSKKDVMGQLEGFIVDEASWHISYLDVKAGDWLSSRSMLIPTGVVESISWANHQVTLRRTYEPTEGRLSG